MKIYLGSDHGGFELKNRLAAYLVKRGYDVEDVGAKELDPNDDYPQFAQAAVTRLLGEDDARAILVCKSGQGMAMAANRFKGVRAAVVWDETEAEVTREDNDSNVLCLSQRELDETEAINIVETWLRTPFSGAPRHKRRIAEIEELGG